MAQPANHLTAEKIANDLGVSKTHIYNLLRSGELPHLRIGKAYRIPRAMYQQWLEEQCLSSSNMKTDAGISIMPTETPDAAESFQHALTANQ